MKKTISTMTALALAFGLLAGCGKSAPLLDAVDYELNTETNETSRGIALGDTPETFLAAYGEYRIFTSVDGGGYQSFDAEEIPFESAVTTLLPTFFVDGLPIDPDAFCEENGIAKADLIGFLSSQDYLHSHTVVYCYLTFTWENGRIAEISSSYMDYNEDAFYYNESSLGNTARFRA